MKDDTMKWVIPALSLGYKISNDSSGRVKFENDNCLIIFRDDKWMMIDDDNHINEYPSLDEALQVGAGV